MGYIRDNIIEINNRIDDAATNRGISSKDITLIAVSKYFPAQACIEAVEAGAKYLGENRVQELTSKYETLGKDEVFWNFIGQLQKNKVKYIIDKVWLIQSLDSFELAEMINKQAKKHGIIVDVLVEVNIGQELQKGGIMPSSLNEFSLSLQSFENIRVKGLMAIPPVAHGDSAREYFKRMKELYEEQKAKNLYQTPLSILSMGMSSDYVEAIEEGSNMVRIGTAIFGRRA